MNPLATFLAFCVIESFPQTIKDQAIGALNLATGPRVSHRDVLGLDDASLTEFPELV
jgi:hypothetical protein